MMNEDTKKFLLRNGFDPEKLNEQLDDTHILRIPTNINGMLRECQTFYKASESRTISVADIYGYEKYSDEKAYYVLESIPYLFDSKGDPYHSRSVSMLDYSSIDVISGLERSFRVEPIKVQEVENNKFVISTNGKHRFTVLKSHYLFEYEKNKNDEEKLNKLKEKYSIPVTCDTLDYIKTYSVYILKLCGLKGRFETDYDENYRKTDLIVFVKLDGTKMKIDDSKLIELTREAINNNPHIKSTIEAKVYLYPSFADYIKKHFPELTIKENREEELHNGIHKN